MTKEFDMEEVKKYMIPYFCKAKTMTKEARNIYLESKLCTIANKFGFMGQMKYPVKYTDPKGRIRHGWISVAWLDEDDNVVLALEVNNMVRARSLIKLNTIVADNKLWIYYGKQTRKFDVALKLYNGDNSIEVVRP